VSKWINESGSLTWCQNMLHVKFQRPGINISRYISISLNCEPKYASKQVSKWVNELDITYNVWRCYIPNCRVLASILPDLSNLPCQYVTNQPSEWVRYPICRPLSLAWQEVGLKELERIEQALQVLPWHVLVVAVYDDLQLLPDSLQSLPDSLQLLANVQ